MVQLPNNTQAIVGPGGVVTPAFWRFFGSLAQAANAGATTANLSAQVQAINERIDTVSNGFAVRGVDSVQSFGSPAGGIVTLQLANDDDAPGNTYFYGTSTTGEKGWRSVASALASTPDIALSVGTDGTTTIGFATLTATALTNLSYPNVVAVDGAGHAYYPDLTNPADVARIVGVTAHAAAAGAPVEITTSRQFTESAWSWSPGRIYCAVSGGGLTQTAPATGAVIEVARVITPQTIRIGIQPAILR